MAEIPPSRTDTNFHNPVPILYVEDLEGSLAYYKDVLGFEELWRLDPVACVSRGGADLFLSRGDQGHPGGWVWIGVGDADALYEELVAHGARIRQAPTNYSWALECHVFDPDGNVLRFGSDSKKGEPFGEWLSQDGTRWAPQDDGSWERVG